MTDFTLPPLRHVETVTTLTERGIDLSPAQVRLILLNWAKDKYGVDFDRLNTSDDDDDIPYVTIDALDETKSRTNHGGIGA